MEDLEQESEQKRVARLKELEELVRKLKSENKQLLNKVRKSQWRQFVLNTTRRTVLYIG